MLTVLCTILPQHLRRIRIGEKTLEVRKTFPNRLLSTSKQVVYDGPVVRTSDKMRVLCCESGSGGRIVCEFMCDGYTELRSDITKPHDYLPDCCLYNYELTEYMGGKPFVFGWHILDPVDYTRKKGKKVRSIQELGIARPPQSWMYLDLPEN